MNPLAIKKNQSGMLLLEVLIAMTIFSFALLGLVAMLSKAVQFSADAEDRNTAALLANEMVSTMWSQQSVDNSVLATQISNWQTSARAKLPPYDTTVTATVSTADANGVVTITVNWTPIGSSTAHTYLTQVAIPPTS